VPFQVIPRELAFFDLFERQSDLVVRGAVDLAAMLADLSHAAHYATRLRELEHDGDEVTHQIMNLVSTTFVAPFDRQDIYALASSLDDVLDAEEGLADMLELLRISEPFPQFRQQVDVLGRATTGVGIAVTDLRSYTGVEEACAEVRRAEREGDWVYRRGVAALYSGDYRAMEVLMWKDLLHQAETAIDHCEDIANTIESVALKHA
jgi:uncharacterized protein Yka (UPF0111/DUF47 family)